MNKLIEKYRNKEFYDLNCAEAMLYSANEKYDLGLSKNALRMTAGFGGGVQEGHLCGIISGAVAVLGIFFKDKVYNDEDLLKITISDFKEKFRELYQNIDCDYLVEHYKTEELGCNDMIAKSSIMLQEVIDKYI